MRRSSPMAAASGEREVDAARVEIHARDLHPYTIAQAVALAGPLAHQLMLAGVEMEVVAAELGDMHQSLHVDIVERHERAEPGDPADAAREDLADAVFHVVALEPGSHVARCFVGTALGHGTV